MKNPVSTQLLAVWFRKWQAPLRRFLYLRTAVRSADLDDVAQEVFLRLMRYERAEVIEQPQAYLYRMAANVAAEWSIRSRNVRPHDSRWLSGLVAESEPESEAVNAEFADKLEAAMTRLNTRQRSVLRLQFVEELSHAEIAARIGASPRTVKRIVAETYLRLRVDLDPILHSAATHGSAETHGRE